MQKQINRPQGAGGDAGSTNKFKNLLSKIPDSKEALRKIEKAIHEEEQRVFRETYERLYGKGECGCGG